MRASFRRLSPLLILALLLGALALFHAAPAQAQETAVWSATLTADQSGVYFGCDNDPGLDDCSGTSGLTEDEFTHGAETYVIDQLIWDSDNDELTFLVFTNVDLTGQEIKTALNSLTLNVGGTALAISDATTETDRIVWSYDPDTDWTDGRRVWLSLRTAAQQSAFASAEGVLDVNFDDGGGQAIGWASSIFSSAPDSTSVDGMVQQDDGRLLVVGTQEYTTSTYIDAVRHDAQTNTSHYTTYNTETSCLAALVEFADREARCKLVLDNGQFPDVHRVWPGLVSETLVFGGADCDYDHVFAHCWIGARESIPTGLCLWLVSM